MHPHAHTPDPATAAAVVKLAGDPLFDQVTELANVCRAHARRHPELLHAVALLGAACDSLADALDHLWSIKIASRPDVDDREPPF